MPAASAIGRPWVRQDLVGQARGPTLRSECTYALAADANLDEVELPLYTTCARLFRANGEIRAAAVSSALDHLADLGGSRVSAALHSFFTGRDVPRTLLVIDSLDEAAGPDDRLREAEALFRGIILTTRPRSWNRRLVIDDHDESHRIGELQPLPLPRRC